MKLKLNLEQKIGSMLILGFLGLDIKLKENKNFFEALNNKKIGCVILYAHNIESSKQLKKLTSDIYQANPDCLIFVDQEGGKVQRLNKNNGFKSYPSAKEIAAKSPQEAGSIYYQMACELKEHGITGNFGPVVDLSNVNVSSSFMGDRSYSSNPDEVIEYANAFIIAHKACGVVTSLKHFPGHGYANGDTHAGLVDTTETFKDIELEPFYALSSKADMIMTAHILNRNIDPDNPATMSKITLDKLRKNNFDGVIVSDDLHMGAVINIENALTKSLQAGCDMIIYSNNPSACKNILDFQPNLTIVDDSIKTIIDAINENVLTIEQIDQSFKRISKLKSISKNQDNFII